MARQLPETYTGVAAFSVANNSVFPLEWCHLQQNWLTQVKALAAYVVLAPCGIARAQNAVHVALYLMAAGAFAWLVMRITAPRSRQSR